MRARTGSAPERRTLLVPLLDLAALMAFTVVGVADHDGGLPLDALARVGLPLLAAWSLAAALVGTYRRPGLPTLVLTWAVSVPVAVLVRTAIAGGPWGGGFLVFLGVALAFHVVVPAARARARARFAPARPRG